MPTSTSTIFGRVSRRRPCRICGKPDWCSYTWDEKISICMRITDGARKTNAHGGAIHIHAEETIAPQGQFRPSLFEATEISQSPLASIEIRDFAYQKLIQISPATLYGGALINGEKGLLARGLTKSDFDNYGALPESGRERDRLAHRLLREAGDRLCTDDGLLGIPGFWKDAHGIHLWKRKDYLLPRLLIPVRDTLGRIQACQMRLPFEMKGLRYCWLSSADLPHGVGSGGPLHFKFGLADLPGNAVIVIVEGILKADVLSVLRPELFIVATPSVTSNHDALIRLSRSHVVWIAFDQDCYVNEAVCLQLARLIAGRKRAEGTLATTRIADWDRRFKGIDDAALRNLPITSISVQCWFTRLSKYLQHKVTTVWQDHMRFRSGRKK